LNFPLSPRSAAWTSIDFVLASTFTQIFALRAVSFLPSCAFPLPFFCPPLRHPSQQGRFPRKFILSSLSLDSCAFSKKNFSLFFHTLGVYEAVSAASQIAERVIRSSESRRFRPPLNSDWRVYSHLTPTTLHGVAPQPTPLPRGHVVPTIGFHDFPSAFFRVRTPFMSSPYGPSSSSGNFRSPRFEGSSRCTDIKKKPYPILDKNLFPGRPPK